MTTFELRGTLGGIFSLLDHADSLAPLELMSGTDVFLETFSGVDKFVSSGDVAVSSPTDVCLTSFLSRLDELAVAPLADSFRRDGKSMGFGADTTVNLALFFGPTSLICPRSDTILTVNEN